MMVMMTTTMSTTLALVSALLASPAQDPEAMRAVRTPALCQSLERKLLDFEARQRRRQVKNETIPVSEGELNSYLNLSPDLKLPEGLSDVQFRLEREQIDAKAALDLDLVRGKAKLGSGSPLDPLTLLSGTIPIEVRGRLKNEDEGFGAFEIQDVRLGPVPLPVSVLAQIVASATRTPQVPQGFDIQAPFRLPYALKRVRVQPGRALLDF
jgi:hypothetical protein